ncbi:MAG: adenylyltransferase/cytidyltransferase family protein [Candidatus Vecturithrix sp.]|jgi:rfaE bifunctional protein nucleotidyltransferase chain/domain|nr:adenylyltransferase/cytidyltransferase family protein [Candidatus Vecturithrix sp.]
MAGQIYNAMKTSSFEKIVPRNKLSSLAKKLKQQGKRIVTTNGSFDLLHIGHVTMLEEAKSLGDVLIVGLNSDSSIKRYKGKYRPICPQQHRAGMLAALACTDYITIFDELTPIKLLEILRPQIHVNSPEHGKECVEREVVERYGGRIHLAQLIEGMSTTQLLQRILDVTSHAPGRGIFLNASDLIEDLSSSSNSSPVSESAIFSLNRLVSQGFQLFIFIEEKEKKSLCSLGIPPQAIMYPLRQPKRDIILRATDAFDLVLAKSIVMSSRAEDIQCGRDLNCKTLWLRSRRAEPIHWSRSAGPHAIIDHVQQIEAYLS